MKLLDIILEDPRSDKNTAEVLIQKLKDSPNTTGLTFGNNVEIKRDGNLIYVKNYSCKFHLGWVRTEWTDFYKVRQGKLGCPYCTKEKRRIKNFLPNQKNYTPNQLTKELIDSPKTSNLTFNDVIYIGIDGFKGDIKIKNYSCKIHPTWFKDTPNFIEFGQGWCH